MLLKCNHCGHIWDYQGGRHTRCTCPKCGKTIYHLVQHLATPEEWRAYLRQECDELYQELVGGG